MKSLTIPSRFHQTQYHPYGQAYRWLSNFLRIGSGLLLFYWFPGPDVHAQVKPTIAVQPQSQTACPGTTVTLSVTATGTAPLRYTWLKNRVVISGATSSTLTFPSVQTSDAGTYRVIVRNNWGTVVSSEAVVQVILSPPSIVSQPQSQTVNAGANVTFTVSATGCAPLQYQWFKNGGAISGATSASLTLNNVQSSNAGSYSVVVSNPGGSTTSATATLTVNPPPNTPPTISNIPDQTINANSATAANAFTVGDVETSVSSLALSGSSSNPTLVPNANIVFGGSGANRTVTITPAPNQTGTATISITVTDSGSLSATASFSFTVTTNTAGQLALGNLVWNDVNGNGLRDAGEPGIANIGVSLFKDDGDGVFGGPADQFIGSTGTDVDGRYQFTNLRPGTYFVGIGGVEFLSGRPLFAMVSSAGAAQPNNDVDNDDNGVDNANLAQNGIFSGPITLALDTEPTNDGDGPDGNQTVDFGFVSSSQPGPSVSISINDSSVTEGNSGTTMVVFMVTLSGSSTQTVSVNYATADGTATAPADYTSTSGTLTFAPNETSKTITVQVYGDTTVEPNETFFVNLSNPANATIADGQGVGTINNDDTAPPSLSINDVTVTEGNSGTVNATFTVTLSAASGQTVTVSFATADGTATAPSDYTSTSGTLTFAPNETTKTITVEVYGDTTVEPNESFNVNRSNPTNATIADGQGVGTVQNDDAAPASQVIGWGDNTVGQASVPQALSSVVGIAAGEFHNLALKADGTVVAWGHNNWGQINVPLGLMNVVAVAGGGIHSLALKGDGTVVAWGSDLYGQTDVPAGLSGVTAIAAGRYHSLALKADGSVIAWGDNRNGQASVPTSGLSGVRESPLAAHIVWR